VETGSESQLRISQVRRLHPRAQRTLQPEGALPGCWASTGIRCEVAESFPPIAAVSQEFVSVLSNNMTMARRQCLECGGELVMAFHPNDGPRLGPGAENRRPSSTWRCSTCGNAFTAEQLRAGRRASARIVEQA
jgi:ribosomal protein S27AE